MLETLLTLGIAAVLLAGASHRFRHAASLPLAAVPLLRAAAVVLIALAFWRCGTPLSGERVVRWIVAASLACGAVVLSLSWMPDAVLRPLRWLLSRRRSA